MEFGACWKESALPSDFTESSISSKKKDGSLFLRAIRRWVFHHCVEALLCKVQLASFTTLCWRLPGSNGHISSGKTSVPCPAPPDQPRCSTHQSHCPMTRRLVRNPGLWKRPANLHCSIVNESEQSWLTCQPFWPEFAEIFTSYWSGYGISTGSDQQIFTWPFSVISRCRFKGGSGFTVDKSIDKFTTDLIACDCWQ